VKEIELEAKERRLDQREEAEKRRVARFKVELNKLEQVVESLNDNQPKVDAVKDSLESPDRLDPSQAVKAEDSGDGGEAQRVVDAKDVTHP